MTHVANMKKKKKAINGKVKQGARKKKKMEEGEGQQQQQQQQLARVQTAGISTHFTCLP